MAEKRTDPSGRTQRRGPADPDLTQRHPPVRPGYGDDFTVRRPPPAPTPGPPIRPPQPPPYGSRPPHGVMPPPMYPPPRPSRRKRRGRRSNPLGCLFKWALVLAFLAVSFVGVFVAVYILAPPPRTNILILGVDARSGEGAATRTDTIILSTIDPSQPYVGMLSIPRDLYVSIPGYGEQRINAAHVLGEVAAPGGGPVLTRQTVEAVFGVPVHRYMRVNFDGFIEIIDAAGGVTVDNERYFIDYAYPTPNYGVMTIEFQPGRQHLSGERALQYARSRHASNDFDRSRRQQQVIQGLIRQMLWPGNWPRIPAVYLAFARNVETDLTIIDALALAPAALWVGPDGIDSRVFDTNLYYGRTTSAGAAVVEARWENLRPVLDQMFFR